MQLDGAGLNELLKVTARKLGHQRRQGAVEPLPVLRGVDGEGPQLAGLREIGTLFRFRPFRGIGQGVGRYN
ncbi:hypothetical protein D9M69_543880 [compost metagenome]